MTPEPARTNIHATAIVVGEIGLLFVGAPGAGKSARAFACLDTAARSGLYAALVADDQVFVSLRAGRIVAEAPATIAGRMELRGSGIVTVKHRTRAVMDCAVRCVPPGTPPRLPDNEQPYAVAGIATLPCIRLAAPAADLGWIEALRRAGAAHDGGFPLRSPLSPI